MHKWGGEIAYENGRISDFQGLMTLTLDRVILHTVIHHSSTSTYTPNFIEIERKFFLVNHNCRYYQLYYGRADGHFRPNNGMRSTSRSQPNKLAPYRSDGRLFATDISAKFKLM